MPELRPPGAQVCSEQPLVSFLDQFSKLHGKSRWGEGEGTKTPVPKAGGLAWIQRPWLQRGQSHDLLEASTPSPKRGKASVQGRWSA